VGRFLRFVAKRLPTQEEGASLVEYALALLLMAVVTLALISSLGASLSRLFQQASNSI